MGLNALNRRAALLGLTVSTFATAAWAKVRAPKVGPLSGEAPKPYNETGDAAADIAAATARAKAKGKLLLVDFGGNWCPDCRVLAAVLEMPKASPFVSKHFEVVYVDVGRKDKNLDLAARYGLAPLKGVPAVAVVAPDGRVLNKGKEFALTSARTWSPQAVVDQLADWTEA